MQLSVRDAARALGVSENKVYRWIKDGDLPARRVNAQYALNRSELLEWALARNLTVAPDVLSEPEADSAPLPGLAETLGAGGVLHRLSGGDKTAVLRSLVGSVQLPPEVDREFLFRVLLAREALGSTGVGDGIAVPHVRNPIVLRVHKPSVTVCYLDAAIDFGAVDGQKVHTLFLVICPTVRLHLHLLSLIGMALRDPEFKGALLRRAPAEEILSVVRRFDPGLGQPPAGEKA